MCVHVDLRPNKFFKQNKIGCNQYPDPDFSCRCPEGSDIYCPIGSIVVIRTHQQIGSVFAMHSAKPFGQVPRLTFFQEQVGWAP